MPAWLGRWRRLAGLGGEAAACLFVAAVYRLRWRDLKALAAEVDPGGPIFCDFSRCFYPTGRAVLVTASPSFRFYYPPFAALAFRPLGVLPLRRAELLWLVVQLVSIAVLLVVPARAVLDSRPGLKVTHALLLLGSLPLIHCLRWGQMSLPLTALALAALLQMEDGRKVLGAVLLALSISLKVYPAILLFYPLVRREWSFIALCAALTFALSVGVPASVMGTAEAWGFFAEVQRRAREALDGWVLVDSDSQSLGHVTARYLHDLRLGRAWFWEALGVAIALANLHLLREAVRARVSRTALWGWTLCMGSLPFVVETSWPHYFAFLPVIQAGLIATLLERGRRNGLAMLLVLTSAILSSTVVLFVVGRWELVSGWGLLFLSNLAALWATWLLVPAEIARARMGTSTA